tara:strand:+ start:308 stop:496 length:189 start_codon:yes stop_codon:yes gene_type:complete
MPTALRTAFMLCVVVVLPDCPAAARFCACIRVMRRLARFGSLSTSSIGATLPRTVAQDRANS